MSRVGLGVRDEASLLLELSRVDLAASETLLEDFQRARGSSRIAFVFVRGFALPAVLGAVATVLATAFAFGFGLRLSFLHNSSPVMSDMVRLGAAVDFRNTVGCRRN